MNDLELARHLISFIDLTDLSEPCSEEAVASLCDKARGPMGSPAALCLWPQFVGFAQRRIGQAIPIATVVNFPHGGGMIDRVLEDIAEAIGDGADEIDLVFPYRDFLSGNSNATSDMVAAAKEQCGVRLLKVILESGAFPDQASLHQAALSALEAGADFLKTSTGKIQTGATEAAARTMLETIRKHGNRAGLKVSGGIRDFAQAKTYYALFKTIMDSEPTPARFRIGASVLFDRLTEMVGRP